MRKVLVALVAVAVIAAAVAVWSLNVERPASAGPDGQAGAGAEPTGGSWWPWASSEPKPSAGRTVRGLVIGPDGPVQDAFVALFRSTEVKAITCPDAERCEPGAPLCDSGDEAARWVERILAQDPTLRPVATGTTDAAGRFTLGTHETVALVLTAHSGDRAGYLAPLEVGEEARLKLEPAWTLRGKLVGAAKEPLAGALVAAFPWSGGPVADTYTAADGTFQLGPLPGGTPAQLVASHGSLAPANRLVEDAGKSVELVLRRPKRLSGKVVRDGLPVGNATVCARAGQRAAIVRTDAAGTFAIENLGGGAGLRETGGGVELVAREGQDRAAARAPVPSAGELVLVLSPGATVYGTVRMADGSPLEGASVEIHVDNQPQRHLKVGPDGKFVERGLPAGLVQVRAVCERCKPAGVERLMAYGDATTLDLVLTRPVLISGVVVDPAGRPANDAQVQAVAVGPASSSLRTTEVVSRGAEFELVVEAAGDYALVATRYGLRSEELQVRAPAEDVRLVVPTGEQVHGDVVRADGRPVADVAVGIRRQDDGVEVVSVNTGAEGRFEASGLAAGRYFAEVAQREGEPLLAKAGFEVPAPGPVRLVVSPGHGLAGRVLDAATGVPVKGVRVDAMFEDESGGRPNDEQPGAWFGSAVSDADGRFSIRGLREGPYFLTVSSEMYDTEPARTAARTGTETVLQVRSRGQIRGRVLTPDGTVATRFRVNHLAQESGDGTFAVRGLITGQQPLTFDAGPGTPSVTVKVKVAYGQDTWMGDVTLPRGVQVRGSVVSARTGLPIQVALVAAMRTRPRYRLHLNAGQVMPMTRTGVDGTFVLENVGPEDKVLVVDHPEYLQWSGPLHADLERVVSLRLGGSVRGRVLDGNGAGLATTLMLVTAEDDTRPHRVASEFDGSYHFTGVEPGTYRVFVQGDGFLPQTRFDPVVVTVRADESVVADLRERVFGSDLTVEVRLPERTRGPFVFLVPGDAPPPANVAEAKGLLVRALIPEMDDSQGPYRFKAVAPGRYTLFAVADGIREDHGEEAIVHQQPLVMPPLSPTLTVVIPPDAPRFSTEEPDPAVAEETP